ncbi:polyprenyl synthetase family protein [Candidatus Woesearchaeota archaeon]|nr:polyprenyl synthetase family protein [Candidatus Woesearchaeota archaeon]
MEFQEFLKKYKKNVDFEIKKFFDRKIKNTKDPILNISYKHLKEFTLRNGKRIRPISSIIAYNSCKTDKKIYPFCFVPELFHASSLVHDDIMDEDSLRRNKKTMHKIFEEYYKKRFKDKKYFGDIFGNLSKRFSTSMGIIQGNILYSLAYSSIIEAKIKNDTKKKILEVFNKAYCKTNEGQIFDLLISSREKSTQKDYIQLVAGKTSAPLTASILFGLIAGNATKNQIMNMERYAHHTGIAFQIHDDIIDISKKMNKGRNLGSDIKKGNKTLLIIKALETKNKNQKKIIQKTLGNEKATKKEINETINAIKDSGALDYCKEFSEKNILLAKKYLKKAKLNKESEKFFYELSDYVIKRKT